MYVFLRINVEILRTSLEYVHSCRAQRFIYKAHLALCQRSRFFPIRKINRDRKKNVTLFKSNTHVEIQMLRVNVRDYKCDHGLLHRWCVLQVILLWREVITMYKLDSMNRFEMIHFRWIKYPTKIECNSLITVFLDEGNEFADSSVFFLTNCNRNKWNLCLEFGTNFTFVQFEDTVDECSVDSLAPDTIDKSHIFFLLWTSRDFVHNALMKYTKNPNIFNCELRSLIEMAVYLITLNRVYDPFYHL